MLNTFSKLHCINRHLRKLDNVLFSFASTGSNPKAMVTWCEKPQYRNFYIVSHDYFFSNTPNDAANPPGNEDSPPWKSNQISYFWEHYSKNISYKQRCALRVADALECFEHKGAALCDEHPRLFLDEIDASIDCINEMAQQGLPRNVIRDNLWILYFTKSDLCSRLNAMKQWNISKSDMLEMLMLLSLPYTTFYKVSSQFIEEKNSIPEGNRMVYVSKLLECPVKVITERFVKNKYLLTRDLNLIVASIKAYLEFGIPKTEIIHDSWCLRYTDSVIRRRLRTAVQEGLPSLKPWMVRCSNEIFENVIQNHRTEQEMLKPFKTREEYLSNKLGIDLPTITAIVEEKSAFRSVRIDKIQAVIEFLLNVGFSGYDICSCPRVFYASIDTIVDRSNELRSHGVEIISLHVILKSETDYQKLLERLKYYKSPDKNIGLHNL